MKTPHILLTAGKGPVKNYQNALTAAGCTYVTCYGLPGDLSSFDGLLLSGGADLDPKYYGQENTASMDIDPLRDESEMALARAFIEMKKPILGICRGLQTLNVALGGTLCQDLPTRALHKGSCDLLHPVTAQKESFLFPLYGETFIANSAHHQGVDILAPALRASARSADGVVEAFEHESLPIFATQFHPERMNPGLAPGETAAGAAVFAFFATVCRT